MKRLALLTKSLGHIYRIVFIESLQELINCLVLIDVATAGCIDIITSMTGRAIRGPAHF